MSHFPHFDSRAVARGVAALDLNLAVICTGLGGLKRANDARLHLGMAYPQAGKKADAIKAFKSVKGTDGTADLARYWIILANRPVS